MDSFTNYEHPIGAIFLIFIIGLIIWGLLGKESRLGGDVYGIILSFAWFLELVSMNLLLVSPLKANIKLRKVSYLKLLLGSFRDKAELIKSI